ncbi:MAG TPA: hypothetical protein VFN21_03230 [Acidimicrobiales bacterium]|nr:hypothetical protein [Acidimicrobiales bacterium]
MSNRPDLSTENASTGPSRIASDSPVLRRPLTRRAVLVGGASALLLAACSSKSSGEASDTTTAATASLLALFPLNDYITAEVPQRIAFAVTDPGGGLTAKGPSSLDFTITEPGGKRTDQNVRGRSSGLPYTYYPIHFTPAKGGNFTVAANVDGSEVTATFTVGAKGSSAVPGPTDKLPSMQSPTTEDHLGVDPICTQDPECPLHATSLDVALGEAKPVVYLVATPKFCQTGVCGPVLEVLEKTATDYADKITFIHQEVYESATEAAEKGATATLASQVQELHIQSEPVLFITDSDGVIRHRLDSVYDHTELSEALDDVLA